MNSPSSKFSGPLFIFGMSRSGTTLLREIICGSKQVTIPRAESLFLPYLIRHFGDFSYPLAEKPKKKLLSVIVKSSFFQSLPRHGIHVEKKHLGMILERGSLQAVVQGLNTIAATGLLKIDYNVKMLKWDVPFEQHTDSDSPTRQSVVVVGRNSGKFKKELRPKEIQAVEKLVFPLAAQWGYVPVSGQVEHTPLRPLPWCYNICGHFFNTLVFHIRRRGWKKGLTFLYWRIKMVFI